ncbi:MAG: hybrid sensor histidine kinase/response regulator [Pseudomonas sp.]|nr:MAG: hybrid sensor histidine kinase/response regulator [Pseudomonas sp.]
MLSQITAKLLIVDDLPENLLALAALIHGEDREVHQAQSAEDALGLLLEHEFALAILDVQMPGMNGFELAELMRGTEKTKHIPIVFVSAAGREMNYAFKGYESGAVDFLHKPLDTMAVKSKVSVFVDLYRQRKVLDRQLQDLERSRQEQEVLLGQLQVARGELERAMLDVSRIRTGKLSLRPRQFDLAQLVSGLVENFEAQALASNTHIELQCCDTVEGEWDEFRIEQVVANLLSNALRYGQRQPVQVRVFEQAGMAWVQVQDHGIGVSAANQQRIFQQFERVAAEQAIGGLGLGLYISEQIVRAHGGQIQIDSEVGQGATFSVLLPLTALSQQTDQAQATSA